MDFTFTPFEEKYLDAVRNFSDQWIGKDYYKDDELLNIVKFSKIGSKSASILAWHNSSIIGIRLTYAPGNLDISKNEFKCSPNKIGYFKSLFISKDFQNKGLGKQLSKISIETLKEMGAKAVLCHSWLESPNNSSQVYLNKMGFEPIKEHKKFWYNINYECPRCSPGRCVCTAIEMIKYLES